MELAAAESRIANGYRPFQLRYGQMTAILILAVRAIATSTVLSARLYLMEQAVCRDYYQINDPTIILPGGRVPEHRCKLDGIQSTLALLSGTLEVATLIPGLLVTPVYTWMATFFGKKTVLFISACGSSLGTCYFTLVCYFHHVFNIKMVLLTGLFDLIGGGNVVQDTLLYTYFTEMTDRRNLSDSFYRLSAFTLAMYSLGSFIGSLLLNVNVWLLSGLGICFYGTSILVIIFLPEVPSKDASVSTLSPSYGTIVHVEDDDASGHNLVVSDRGYYVPKISMSLHRFIIYNVLRSFSTLYDTLRDPVCSTPIYIFFLSTAAMSIGVIFKQWTSKVFDWTLADLNAILAFEDVVNGTVLISLPLLSKYVLLPRLSSRHDVDIWIVRFSLTAFILGVICIGIAPSRIIYLIALTVYNLGIGFSDALRSYSTNALKDEKDIRALYMGLSVSVAISGILGTTFWSTIFSASIATVRTYLRGAPFCGAGILFIIALFLTKKLQRHIENLKPEEQA